MTEEEAQLNQQLTSKDVRALMGNISDMTLWRMEKDESCGFPKPTRIRRRRYWSGAELDAWLSQKSEA